MNDDDGIRDAVESGDLHGCQDCHGVSEGRFCPDCDEGRCEICGALVKKGEPFTRDPAFSASCFCGECGEIAAEPSVAELAARLSEKGAA